MARHTSTDLDGLRADIAQTGGVLVHRVEQLVTRSDLPARLRSTAVDGMGTAKDAAATAAHQAATIAEAAAGRVHAGVESLWSAIEDRDVRYLVRRPVPLGVALGGAAAVAIVVYLAARRRH
jgi:hypothetical protein